MAQAIEVAQRLLTVVSATQYSGEPALNLSPDEEVLWMQLNQAQGSFLKVLAWLDEPRTILEDVQEEESGTVSDRRVSGCSGAGRQK